MHVVRRGFALESTLLLLVLFGALIGVATAAIAVYTRTSGVDVKASRVAYAAEGAGDQIMSQLDAAMADGIITPGDISSLTPPVLPGFSFTQETAIVGAPVNRIITRGAFAGLYALEQPMSVRINAHDATQNRAAIELGVSVQSVPIFQFGVFYDRDLEINNGPPMTFAGWVHSNRHLYMSSANANYMNQITSADSVFWSRKDAAITLAGIRIANNASVLTPLDFDSRSHPGATFVARSNLRFNGRLKSRVSGVRPLRLPLPGGMDPVELVLPAQGGDSPDVAAVRMANKADLRIVVNVANPLADICAEATFIRAAGRTPLGAACPLVFQFTRNAFWDGREMKRPDVLELDLAQLRNFVNVNPADRQVSIIYVEFQGRDSTVALRDYPALRIRNGAQLPDPSAPGEPGGLTVTTNAAMYVRGNYNTVNWKPAALIGDVVTFQSNAWNDATSTTYPRSMATATSVWAALLAGNSETPCDARVCGGPQQYGGGLENFPRFLENWSGVPMNYTGSLVSLFVSRQSSGVWGHNLNGGRPYYNPPNRNWSFETRFQNPMLLPPGTPRLGSVLQISYRNVF
ncbi:MAG: hypothetical protein U5K74_06025 [Gemmatimonadaceae bacterium]|nr:hypothetical protein [Gemmatimonadaceae bacterium]